MSCACGVKDCRFGDCGSGDSGVVLYRHRNCRPRYLDWLRMCPRGSPQGPRNETRVANPTAQGCRQDIRPGTVTVDYPPMALGAPSPPRTRALYSRPGLGPWLLVFELDGRVAVCRFRWPAWSISAGATKGPRLTKLDGRVCSRLLTLRLYLPVLCQRQP